MLLNNDITHKKRQIDDLTNKKFIEGEATTRELKNLINENK